MHHIQKSSSTDIDAVFERLISVDKELKKHFNSYIAHEYNTHLEPRLYYIDMAEIAKFVVNDFKKSQFLGIKELFINIEHILENCDTEIENLIIVGLFEGIQNIAGNEIDYHHGFDSYLLPLSKTKWGNLIDQWEGLHWRNG